MKNTNLKLKRVQLFALCGLLGFLNIGVADVAIVVNASSGVSSISASEAKKLFLGKKKKFPNGSPASPVEQVEGSAVRSAFNDKVLSKSDAKLKSYWSKIIFSGKGAPPEQVADDAAVKSWLAANKNGIGYVDSGAVDASVKVVLKVP